MKDYTLGNKNKEDYITKVIKEKDNTYTIKLADGKVIRRINVNEENFAKIIEIQEKQASEGVNNLSKHLDKARDFKNRCVITFLGSATVGTGLLCAFANNGVQTLENPLVLALSAGVVTALATIPSLAKLVKQNKIVEEIKKIDYRDNHRIYLDNFKNSQNALNGLNKIKANKLKKEENPFSILNIDDFSQKDLESIVEYMKLEETLGFSYKKENVGKRVK